MKDYKLRILPLFEEDLDQIIDYICIQLENPQSASALLEEVYAAIMKRLPHAESFEAYPSKKQHKQTYYRIYVKNYVVFYVVQDEYMEVRRILYGGRDWKKQL